MGEVMLGTRRIYFYDFPAQHWSHLRTTNPIGSTFATVRLRTQRTKGCGSRLATLTMVFKLGTLLKIAANFRCEFARLCLAAFSLVGYQPPLLLGTK